MNGTKALSSFLDDQSDMNGGVEPNHPSKDSGGEDNHFSLTSTLSPTRYSFAKNFLVSMVSLMG